VCNCSKGSGSKWQVRFPNGTTETKDSAAAARMAAAKVPGATVQKTG
jgi:hypothetical protein